MRLAPSPAAQFQAMKTRAVLGAQLIWQALTFLLALWIVLTTFIIWHQVGVYLPALDHAFFGRWIVCSLLDRDAVPEPLHRLDVDSSQRHLPARRRRSARGSPAPKCTVTPSTRRSGIQPETAGDWSPTSCRSRSPDCCSAWRWRQDPATGDHLRGLRLLTPRRHNREMHGGAIARLLHGRPRGIRLGKSIIPERSECEHFLITGNPGAGKSTAIRAMLKQITERGQAAIVIDPESEYVQEFYSEERGDWILNPLDRRCPYWSPWSELRDDSFSVNAAAMAASLIRGRPRSESEKFFQDSTRTVAEAILHVVRDHGDAGELLKLVSLPRGELHEALRGTPAYALVDPEAHDQGAGILGTATNAIKTFIHLPKRQENARTWSARAMGRESLRLDIPAVARGHQRSHPRAAGPLARLPGALADDRRHRRRSNLGHGRRTRLTRTPATD